MSNALIAFFFAAGFGGWAYAKFNRYTGNNTKSSAIGAGLASLLVFLVLFFVLGFITKK
jgi:hypothetical protein